MMIHVSCENQDKHEASANNSGACKILLVQKTNRARTLHCRGIAGKYHGARHLMNLELLNTSGQNKVEFCNFS